MKISHYYPHSGGILGCHANVDFQHTNYLLNVTICEKLRCAHKLQTISDAFSHIASRFVKVALAIKFALNWLAGPQCTGHSPTRAGEMNPEVDVTTRPWGLQRKGSPSVSKGPKPPTQLSQLLKNSQREVKRAHFRYILGPRRSHPVNGVNGDPEGKVPPSPPPPTGFSSHVPDAQIPTCCQTLAP